MSTLGPASIPPRDDDRIERAAGVLARAFHEYPLFLTLYPDGKRRKQALLWYMEFVLRYCGRYGEVLAAAGDQAILALLDKPHPFNRRRLLAAGILRGPLRMGLVPFRRMMQHNNRIAAANARLIPPDAWYVWMVGVDPAARGHGLGNQVLAGALAAADEAGAACSCDTDRRDVLGFFAHHGFRVVHEGRAPLNGSPFWVLLRPPGPPADRRRKS